MIYSNKEKMRIINEKQKQSLLSLSYPTNWYFKNYLMHICKKGQHPEHWKYQMLVMMWSNRNSDLLQKECKIVQPLWKPAWQFLKKLNIQSSNCIPWYLPRKGENMSIQKTYTQMFIYFILNCQNLEATKMYPHRWMNKLWYIQTMKYYLCSY